MRRTNASVEPPLHPPLPSLPPPTPSPFPQPSKPFPTPLECPSLSLPPPLRTPLPSGSLGPEAKGTAGTDSSPLASVFTSLSQPPSLGRRGKHLQQLSGAIKTGKRVRACFHPYELRLSSPFTLLHAFHPYALNPQVFTLVALSTLFTLILTLHS